MLLNIRGVRADCAFTERTSWRAELHDCLRIVDETPLLALLARIEPIDEAAVVQLFDEPQLGEVLRLGGFRLRVFFTKGV